MDRAPLSSRLATHNTRKGMITVSQMTPDAFDVLRHAVLVRTPTAIMHLFDGTAVAPSVLRDLVDQDLVKPFDGGHYALTHKGCSLRCRLL